MMRKKINIIIDGKDYLVDEGTTILNACKEVGINIPHLCFMEDVASNASCAICCIEVKDSKKLVRSCSYSVWADMEITTNSERIRKARKTNLELILANHPDDCLKCDRNQNCELQKLAWELGVREQHYAKTRTKTLPLDTSSPSLIRDPNKCILCNRCISVCSEIQTVNAIDVTGRGLHSRVTTFMDRGLGNSVCTNCGQCSLVCPTGAIVEKSDISSIWRDIYDPDIFTIIQTAPAIRIGIGEAMGMESGALVTGKMVAGIRKLGFDRVFDTQFTADLTIMEEGHELIKRISTGGTLPMITSCSPGWIKFIEHFFPDQLANISTCKSPQQMFGALAKTWYAGQADLDPEKIRVISVMPCTAKKYEAERPEMNSAFHYWKERKKLTNRAGFPDVDYALTTRELARMFRETGLDFAGLPEEEFDNPLGKSTGAAVIFGATGGVMEAALRTAYEVLTGTTLDKVEFADVRGMEGIKEAEINIKGKPVRVAVAHTLKNARKLLDEIKEGKSPYAFIEVMACPGGCLGGGGQPIPTTWEIRKKRAESIYREDINLGIRKSHENPEIQALYRNFLIKPLGEISHHLLHTSYTPKSV